MNFQKKIYRYLSFIVLIGFSGCYAPLEFKQITATKPPEKKASYFISHLDRYSVREWKYIVIHHSASESGCAAEFDKFHREKRHWENGLGYHFVIGNGNG
ncbi:MAG: hypothetical protein FJ264_09150 [Planctomycetes bacterium]|nr:hypothetical protein [Planctomycetota bacterium]